MGHTIRVGALCLAMSGLWMASAFAQDEELEIAPQSEAEVGDVVIEQPEPEAEVKKEPAPEAPAEEAPKTEAPEKKDDGPRPIVRPSERDEKPRNPVAAFWFVLRES